MAETWLSTLGEAGLCLHLLPPFSVQHICGACKVYRGKSRVSETVHMEGGVWSCVES